MITNPLMHTCCSDDNFDANAANAVCQYFGFASGEALSLATFGQGTGPIHLDGFNCSSTAVRLDLCSIRAWDDHDCSHLEDAGVRCSELVVDESKQHF